MPCRRAARSGSCGAGRGPRGVLAARRAEPPTDLAVNGLGVDLTLYVGNGLVDPDRGESLLEASAGCAVEVNVQQETLNLHAALDAAGVSHQLVQLRWGCHTSAQASYGIGKVLPHFADVFAGPSPPPAVFSFRAIEPTVSAWGWEVDTDPNRAVEFLALRNVSRDGLTVSGSGLTTVTTPPMFRNAKRMIVTQYGVPRVSYPDKTGRLTFTVDLGPANRQQQYTLGAMTVVSSTTVRFSTG